MIVKYLVLLGWSYLGGKVNLIHIDYINNIMTLFGKLYITK